ncbi:MAG: hypothetical protein CVV31_09205 [Methanomicrobiales archaeon HGW-Methanomicrobiales-2]|jgi:hypothetical protein|nr:MAG: hypothetical protein CVV31_09205 [Methanomicrobiales archaeon HGW-Methanomicrobiales-2]
MKIPPATKENPRQVTREMIEVFEANNPVLAGIGAIMLDMGVWCVNENSDENKDSRKAPTKAPLSDTRGSTYARTFIDCTI